MHYPPRTGSNEVGLLQQMLAPKMLTHSYKLYWFAAILDHIPTGKKSLSYSTLVKGMIARAWYPVTRFRMSLGVRDELEALVRKLAKNHYATLGSANSANHFLEAFAQVPLDEYSSELKQLTRYVPARLLSPFCASELIGLKDHQRDAKITACSLKGPNFFYQNISKERRIVLSDAWIEYLTKNLGIVQGWWNNKLVNFLQARNPNMPAISLKILPPAARSLAAQKGFWKHVIAACANRGEPLLDVYSQRPLSLEDVSLDHFIPWRYVYHDLMWNLTPTTKSINSSKSDNLPPLQPYLGRMLLQQRKAIEVAVGTFPKRLKVLDDYILLLNDHMVTTPKQLLSLPVEAFRLKLTDTFVPLHKMAANAGFPTWHGQPSQ